MVKANGKIIQLSKKNKVELSNILAHYSDYVFINHFRLNMNNCIVRLIPKSFLDTFITHIEIKNNELHDYPKSERLVYSNIFTNELWDNLSYNHISYSPFMYGNTSETMTHYSFRGKSLSFGLLENIDYTGSVCYNDICIHSYSKVSDLPELSNFVNCNEDYYLVITHGYVLYEDFNKDIKSNSANLLKSLIPFETYKRDYIYRMATPLHIYNACTHNDFLRLSFIGLMGYLMGFEKDNLFITHGNLSKLLSILKTEYSSKINKNTKLLENKKSLCLLVPNNQKVSKITLDISKDGSFVNSITDFTYPDISNISKLPHDVSENFIHDNLSSLPILNYGLGGILDIIMQNYSRSCCDGKEIERCVIHLDLDDLLNVCNPQLNADANLNGFYSDWKCFNLVNIVGCLCQNSSISFKQFQEDFVDIVSNIENKLNEIPESEKFKYKSIPFILLFSFILYRLTGRLNGTYKEQLLKYRPNVEISTNGLFNYSSTIDNYIKTGVIELENKCPKNVQKIEKEYDWSDLEGFSLSGNDLIQTFESEAESFMNQEKGFDTETLNKFGNFGELDFHDNVEKAKELTSEDLEKKDFLSVFGGAEEVKASDDIEDMSNEDLVEFFGSSKGLNLNYDTNFDNIIEAPDLSQEYPTNPHREFGEDEPIPTHHPLKDFDTGLGEFFKTSPYFDNNEDLRSILLDDIFNPGLNYSVAQIKSLIAREGISIDIFRKELLSRTLKKINSDEDIFEVYTALKNLF